MKGGNLTPGEAPRLEAMYTIDEIADAWKVNKDTVTRIFRDRPGVIHLGSPKKRILRVPASVYEAVMREKCLLSKSA